MIRMFKKFINNLSLLHLIIIFIASLPITAYFLRQNNLKMVELTQSVIAIDETSKGDIETIAPAIEALRDHVTTHMNAGMKSPVQLQNRYNRVVNELLAQKEKEDSKYRKIIYQKAQSKCAASALSIRVACIQEYIVSQPGVEPLALPPVEQFSYEFISPLWSADVAGLAVVTTILLGLSVLTLLVTEFLWPKAKNIVADDPLE